MEILWDVYRADVRGFAVDIWAFMRTVKANVITVERVFGEPRCLSGYGDKGACVCVFAGSFTLLYFSLHTFWIRSMHCYGECAKFTHYS